MSDLYQHLEHALPTDHARQVHSAEMVKTWLRDHKVQSILDLGCGDGRSIDLFARAAPGASWTGIDIEGSPEVSSRTRTDGTFVTYDGRTFPFPDKSFDLVYSHQVFEHVRYPEVVLAEVFRTIRPGGTFIGSTSQLEPYHSYSFWNYTIYGFSVLLAEAGFKLDELRPGIDGITLIRRSMTKDRAPFARYFSEESPVNAEIARAARLRLRSTRVVNFRKLNYCGHFVFRATRPD